MTPFMHTIHHVCTHVQVKLLIAITLLNLKLKLRKYPSIHTNHIISHSTILQYNHNIWYGSYAEKKYWTRKTMISTGLPYLQFSMNSQGFSQARLTWPAYDGGRKRENSSAWKHRIIIASTCRRCVEFGRYVTWLWMSNCVSVMTKNAAFVYFRHPLPWKASLKNVTMCARNSRKSCLIGWLHSIKGTSQPPLTLRM